LTPGKSKELALSEKIRVGFIGSGGIARWHYENLLKTGRAEVVAVADPNPAGYNRIAEKHPEFGEAKLFGDHREMLENTELDAVMIQTPHCHHSEEIADAFARGLHVMCDKPMAGSADQARQIISLRDSAERVFVLTYQRKYQPQYTEARKLIEEGRIGEVECIVAVLLQGWLDFVAGTWRVDPVASCGGQLNDSGSHIVHVVPWVTNLRPESVYCSTQNLGQAVEVNAAMTVQMQNGAIWAATIVGNGVGFSEELWVFGKDGMLSVVDDKLRLCKRGGEPQDVELPAGSTPESNFVAAILDGAPVVCGAEDGLQAALLTEAAYESARAKVPVPVAPR
jgi:predicted dehydrogenase